MGRLERHLDQDSIARLQSGVKKQESGPTIKRAKPIRSASTYRACRRNAYLRGDVKGTWRGAKFEPERFPPHIQLNRSQNHPPAATYIAARAISPVPNSSVR